MKIDFEMIALMALGTVISSSQAQIDAAVDAAAAKICSAVNDSSTQLDDVAAKALAAALKRLAAAVEAGV